MTGQVNREWEAFMAGASAAPTVRAVVAASWSRSKNLRISTSRRKAPLAEEGELYRQRGANRTLLDAAGPALSHSRALLADSGSMMILTDATGLIMETQGDRRVMDEGCANHLQRGGRWREDDIGTNAIGTALAEDRPVQIRGSEHFAQDVKRWTCAAVPLHDPADHSLLGIIDISGPAAHFNPQSLALAASLGREIEAILDRGLKIEHERLLSWFLTRRGRWLSNDMVVIDRHGRLVHATTDSARFLGTAAWEPGLLKGLPLEQWREILARRHPGTALEPCFHDGELLGAVLVGEGHGKAHAVGTVASSKARTTGDSFGAILGESEAMHAARERALRIAMSGLPVLIEGETGVGKELFARAIRDAARPADAPFVPVNCGGIPHDLIASELFGYTRGSFTGADEKGRGGRILAADGGTLCLDEIGEMPLDLQPYLLRVLEDRMVYPIGSSIGTQVELHIISMTNRDLLREVEAGSFRSDLFYRIAAARLTIPPLRERGEDVLLLTRHFASEAARRLDCAEPGFDPETLALLRAYRWPGNVRELRNVIEVLVALSRGYPIQPDDLPNEIRMQSATPFAPAPSGGNDLRNLERAAIITCLEACAGNCTEASRRLGISRSTLYVRLAEYGIARPHSRRL